MSEARLAKALKSVRKETDITPDIAIILGSGLGDYAKRIEGASISYDDIDGFPAATAPNHKGVLHIGELCGQTVIILQGRLHLYEGHSPQDAAFPVELAKALGANTIILTNVSGSLNPDYAPGDIVSISDHIYFPGLTGQGALVGRRDADRSPFVNLTQTYDASLLNLADKGPAGRLQRGVYGCLAGPHFETPAEGRMLRMIGADMVGMSTIHEAVMARYLEMRVLGLSLIVNPVVTDVPAQGVVDEADIWSVVENAAGPFEALLDHTLRNLPTD